MDDRNFQQYGGNNQGFLYVSFDEILDFDPFDEMYNELMRPVDPSVSPIPPNEVAETYDELQGIVTKNYDKCFDKPINNSNVHSSNENIFPSSSFSETGVPEQTSNSYFGPQYSPISPPETGCPVETPSDLYDPNKRQQSFAGTPAICPAYEEEYQVVTDDDIQRTIDSLHPIKNDPVQQEISFAQADDIHSLPQDDNNSYVEKSLEISKSYEESSTQTVEIESKLKEFHCASVQTIKEESDKTKEEVEKLDDGVQTECKEFTCSSMQTVEEPSSKLKDEVAVKLEDGALPDFVEPVQSSWPPNLTEFATIHFYMSVSLNPEVKNTEKESRSLESFCLLIQYGLFKGDFKENLEKLKMLAENIDKRFRYPREMILRYFMLHKMSSLNWHVMNPPVDCIEQKFHQEPFVKKLENLQKNKFGQMLVIFLYGLESDHNLGEIFQYFLLHKEFCLFFREWYNNIIKSLNDSKVKELNYYFLKLFYLYKEKRVYYFKPSPSNPNCVTLLFSDKLLEFVRVCLHLPANLVHSFPGKLLIALLPPSGSLFKLSPCWALDMENVVFLHDDTNDENIIKDENAMFPYILEFKEFSTDFHQTMDYKNTYTTLLRVPTFVMEQKYQFVLYHSKVKLPSIKFVFCQSDMPEEKSLDILQKVYKLDDMGEMPSPFFPLAYPENQVLPLTFKYPILDKLIVKEAKIKTISNQLINALNKLSKTLGNHKNIIFSLPDEQNSEVKYKLKYDRISCSCGYKAPENKPLLESNFFINISIEKISESTTNPIKEAEIVEVIDIPPSGMMELNSSYSQFGSWASASSTNISFELPDTSQGEKSGSQKDGTKSSAVDCLPKASKQYRNKEINLKDNETNFSQINCLPEDSGECRKENINPQNKEIKYSETDYSLKVSEQFTKEKTDLEQESLQINSLSEISEFESKEKDEAESFEMDFSSKCSLENKNEIEKDKILRKEEENKFLQMNVSKEKINDQEVETKSLQSTSSATRRRSMFNQGKNKKRNKKKNRRRSMKF